MATSPSLEELNQVYQAVPHTGIESNEPYATTGLPEFASERKLARIGFLQGENNWPQVSYPRLDVPSLAASENTYWQVLNGVITHDSAGDSGESNVLYANAARKLAEVYRHMESRRQSGSVLPGAVELSRERAGGLSAELFGTPDKAAFRSLLAIDVRASLQNLQSSDATRSALAQDHLSLLGMTPASAQAYAEQYDVVPPAELTDETIQTVRDDLTALFPKLAGMMETFQRSGDTLAADAVPAFDAVLDAFGLNEKGWKVRLIPGTHAADAYGPTKEILYGRERQPFTPSSIIGVPVHEGLHALRKQNASEQQAPARRTALPGSLDADEGFCVAIEQAVTGKKRIGGKQYYTQLGLQLGLETDYAKPRDFRQTFEIMWRQRALSQKGDLDDAMLAKQKDLAYAAVMRTTRGGSNDFRDICYFEGTRKAIEFLNSLTSKPAAERQQTLSWVMSGVFDPTNSEHARIFGKSQ